MSSSISASSGLTELDPTELDMLAGRKSRLLASGEICVGDPESPSVFRDNLRCCVDWAFVAGVTMELGSDGGAGWMGGLKKGSAKEGRGDKEL